MAVAALTEEQQEIRSTGIGASEIGALVGLDPYKGPVDIYARKLRLVPDEEAGEPARWGQRLEAVIAEAYAEEEGIASSWLASPGTLRHPEHPVVIATPDRIRLRGPGPIEVWDRNVQIKTASLRVADQWGEAEDDIPASYLAQVQYEMAVTGLPVTDLPVLIGGNRMKIYRIAADAELQEMLIDAALKFWRDCIVKGEPPAIDGSERWAEHLKRKFPRDERPMLPATDEARDLLTALGRARRAKEIAEEAEGSAANRLKALIGDAAGIEGIATWKTTKGRNAVDWEAMARHQGASDAMIAKFTTTRPGYRTFRPKLPKE